MAASSSLSSILQHQILAATTTMAASISAGAGVDEDHAPETTQQMVKSFNPQTDFHKDMQFIFSSFDNRLPNIKTTMTNEDEDLNALLASLKAAESVIHRWDCGNDSSCHSSSSSGNHGYSSFFLSFDKSPEEAMEYLSAVDKIISLFWDISVQYKPDIVGRVYSTLQMAMSQLEDVFRQILIRNTERLYGSMRSLALLCADDNVVEDFENFGLGTDQDGSRSKCDLRVNPTIVEDLKKIAERMIRAGHEKECVHVYSSVRSDALDECLMILGVDKLSMEEEQKIDWKFMDEKIKKWIQAVKITVSVLLVSEKKLCQEIFSGSESSKEVCYKETTKSCVVQLLNFGVVVAIGRRSPEKLFRILDMYNALANVMKNLEVVTDCLLRKQTKGLLEALADAARGALIEFEYNVRTNTSERLTTNGDVHPMVHYVMNYVELIVGDYSVTLNFLLDNDDLDGLSKDELYGLYGNDCTEEISPLAKRLFRLIMSLESNLRETLKLHEDGMLHNVFMMNNIKYIGLKVKDSNLGKILGNGWVRNQIGKLRKYATAYVKASSSWVLSTLRYDSLSGSLRGGRSYGQKSKNLSEMTIKDRFIVFNATFEELYRLQTAWKVPDPQLREELRISIADIVIPAYRAFLGWSKNQLGYSDAEKYIKYTLDDLESYLPDLFEGTQLVIHHPRRKS